MGDDMAHAADAATADDTGTLGDRLWMARALDVARAASEHGDVPVGAIVVRGADAVASAGNRREVDTDPTAHAEVLALRAAASRLGTWRLDDCTLYVTLEPCTMCAGALVLARLGRLVFGAVDPKGGAVGSLYDVPGDARLNHRVEVTGGVAAGECGDVLRAFFQARRGRGAAVSGAAGPASVAGPGGVA